MHAPPKTLLLSVVVGVLAAVAVFVPPLTPTKQISAKTMNSPSQQNRCFGRFTIAAPEELSVSGRSQSIYRVDVSTLPLPAGGVDALWNERLTKIRTLKPPKGKSETLIRGYELQPGIRAAWYFPNSADSELRKLEAIVPQPAHALVVSRGGLVGKEASVETLLKTVFDSYLPGQYQGFCVGFGSINSKPGLNEQSLTNFSDQRAPGLTIRFETQTVSEPDTHSYSTLDEEEQVIKGTGGSMSVLLNQPRSAAGLNGTEIRVSVKPSAEAPFVRYTWHFPGLPGDSFKPMINLVGMAPTSQENVLKEIWENLLRSLRSNAPTQPRSGP